MSKIRTKIKYEKMGTYGSTDIGTLYAVNNVSCDCVTIYDETGDIVLSFCEWGTKDLGTQLVKLLTNFSPEDNDEVEYWDMEDVEFFNKLNK